MTRTISKPSHISLILVGFAIWLIASVIVRVVGQWLFVPSQPVITLIVFIVGMIGLFFLMRLLLNAFKIEPDQRERAAAWMLFAPLLLDGMTITFVGVLFPNLSEGAALLFGGWLLTLYGVGFWSALSYSSNRSL